MASTATFSFPANPLSSSRKPSSSSSQNPSSSPAAEPSPLGPASPPRNVASAAEFGSLSGSALDAESLTNRSSSSVKSPRRSSSASEPSSACTAAGGFVDITVSWRSFSASEPSPPVLRQKGLWILFSSRGLCQHGKPHMPVQRGRVSGYHNPLWHILRRTDPCLALQRSWMFVSLWDQCGTYVGMLNPRRPITSQHLQPRPPIV
jgi:hypothetical protein